MPSSLANSVAFSFMYIAPVSVSNSLKQTMSACWFSISVTKRLMSFETLLLPRYSNDLMFHSMHLSFTSCASASACGKKSPAKRAAPKIYLLIFMA